MSNVSTVRNRNAFTIIELLVVIAIIGILALISTNINFNRLSAEEKGARITNSIGSIIRTEIGKNILGKAISTGSDFIYPTRTTVTVTQSGIQVNYYSGSTVIPGDVVSSPFFGDPLYTITSINGSSRDATYTLNNTDAIVLELIPGEKNELYYSGATRERIYNLSIDTSYIGQSKTIEYDSRTNVVKY